jgi:Secretion system C-terminal sorting domain
MNQQQMKTKITTIIIAFAIIGLSAKAQNSTHYKNELPSFLSNTYKPANLEKSPQSQTFKPSWGWFYNWNSVINNWTIIDSANYFYNTIGNSTLDTLYYPSVKYAQTYTYNSNNKLINLLRQSYSGGVWMNQSNIEYTYDANNNELSNTYKYWNGFNWYNSFRYVNTYDANNNQTQSLYQRWNGVNWKDFNKSNYVFDANNSLIGYDYYTNDTTTNTWSGLYKADYIFDAVHITKAFAYKWNAATSTWDSLNKSILTYTGSICSSYNTYKWNGSAWQNNQRSTALVWHEGGYFPVGTNLFTSPSNTSNEIIQVWKPASSTWVDTLKYTNAWDANNNQTDQQLETYIGSAWQTYSYAKDFFTYDVNNNITQHIYQTWNTTSQSLVNNKKDVFANYQLFISTDDMEADNNLLVYPNPTDKELKVESQKSNLKKITIYNVLGECVLSQSIGYRQQAIINISALQQGLYFVELQTEKETIIKKILKQ